MSVAGLWSLDADPATLEAAAKGWQRLAKTWDDAADALNRAVAKVDGWLGTSADTYDAHRSTFTRDLRKAAATARSVEAALKDAAFLARTAQEHLDEGFAVIRTVSHGVENGRLVFHPADEGEKARVDAAIADAEDVRRWLDSHLASRRATIAHATAAMSDLDRFWRAYADGKPTFTLPPGAETATGIIYDPVAKQVIVQTGSLNDQVQVGTDRTGRVYVSHFGTPHYLDGAESVIIRTGDGNDQVTVEGNPAVRITVMSGAGDDQVKLGAGDDRVYAGAGSDLVRTYAGNDRISGGTGRDSISAGAGDDIVKGGSGGDVIRGLDGADRLLAGEGNDYVDGSRGDDVVFGDGGRDIVSGGRGDDILSGGRDDDRFFTGLGADTVTHGAGADVAHGQTGEDRLDADTVVNVDMTGEPGHRIRLHEYTQEWTERTEADLDFMRASEVGRQQLAAMDEAGRSRWFTWQEGFLTPERRVVMVEAEAPLHDVQRTSREYVIQYSPDLIADGTPAPVAAFHEFGHVRQHEGGYHPDGRYSGSNSVDHEVRVAEIANIGRPFIDHDGDPTTPEIHYDRQPYESTEAAFREVLGMPARESYNQADGQSEFLTE